MDKPQHRRGSLTWDHSSHRKVSRHRLIYNIIGNTWAAERGYRDRSRLEVSEDRESPAVTALTLLDPPPKKRGPRPPLSASFSQRPSALLSHLKTRIAAKPLWTLTVPRWISYQPCAQ